MDIIAGSRFVGWRGAAPAWGRVGQARSRSRSPALMSHNAYYVNSAKASSDFDLSIGALPVNYTGRPANAVAINGGVPGPLLRWRQGDTVTLRVANRLGVDTSIHWHGILLPSNMDGVPGLSFHGIRPGETFAYRFTLKQAGTYWYHGHSRDRKSVV